MFTSFLAHLLLTAALFCALLITLPSYRLDQRRRKLGISNDWLPTEETVTALLAKSKLPLFPCPDCKMARSVLHDCMAGLGKQSQSLPQALAWHGDLLQKAHIVMSLPRINHDLLAQLTSNAHQAKALATLRPDAVPPPNPNGTPPSVHTIATQFEVLYATDLNFRLDWAESVRPNLFIAPETIYINLSSPRGILNSV